MTNKTYVDALHRNGVMTAEKALGLDPDRVVRMFQPASMVKGEIGEDGLLWVATRASTPDIDEAQEIVEPTAFNSSIDRFGEFPVMLAYHDMRQPVGRWERRELSKAGLYMEGFVSSGRADVQRLTIDKVLMATSIGFFIKEDEWDDELQVRRIKDLELVEVSLVPVPMNRSTWLEPLKGMGFRAWAQRQEEGERVKAAAWEDDVVGEMMAAAMSLARMLKHAPIV